MPDKDLDYRLECQVDMETNLAFRALCETEKKALSAKMRELIVRELRSRYLLS